MKLILEHPEYLGQAKVNLIKDVIKRYENTYDYKKKKVFDPGTLSDMLNDTSLGTQFTIGYAGSHVYISLKNNNRIVLIHKEQV